MAAEGWRTACGGNSKTEKMRRAILGSGHAVGRNRGCDACEETASSSLWLWKSWV